MKNYIVKGFLFLCIFFNLIIVSCDDNSVDKSVITRFEPFPVTSETSPLVVSENAAGVYTFDFVMDERQIVPMTLEIHVASSSTATEGEDFQLLTHDIELLALEGREGFSIDISVLDDSESGESDETISLVFSSTLPSGVEKSETLVITIQDN